MSGTMQVDNISIDDLDMTDESVNQLERKYNKPNYRKAPLSKPGRVYHNGKSLRELRMRHYDNPKSMAESYEEEMRKKRQIEEYCGAYMHDIAKNNVMSQDQFEDADSLIARRCIIAGNKAKESMDIRASMTVRQFKPYYEQELKEAEERIWYDADFYNI